MRKAAGLAVVVLLAVTGFLVLRARHRRALEEGNRARLAEERDAHVARASHPGPPKVRALEVIRALRIDHELREPPDEDRLALFAVAYGGRRYAEHFVVESTAPFSDAAFKADGAELAIVGEEPVLRVVDVMTEKVTTSPLPEPALRVRWQTGTELVVVMRTLTEVRTDHGATLIARKPATPDAPEKPSPAIADSGARTARAGDDGRIRILDARSLELLEELDGHTGPITTLAWSPSDPRRLVSTSRDGTATLWKLGQPGLVRLLRPGPNPPRFTRGGDIAFLDRSHVATFDARTAKPLRYFRSASPLGVATVYERRVLGVSRGGDVLAWDAKSEAQVGENVRLATSDADVVLARDAPFALACRAAGCAVLDGDAREVMKVNPPNGIKAKLIAPDGREVAIAGLDGAWTIFDVETKMQRGTIPSDGTRAMFGGSNLAVARPNGVGIHAPSGKEIATLPGVLDDVSEDGAFLRTLDNGNAAYFRSSSGGKRGAVEHAEGKLHALTPNGRHDAVVDGNDVWVRSTDGGLIAKLSGHTAPITALSWSGDGRYLATASEDRTLRLWEVGRTLRALIVIPLEEMPASIELSRDAAQILTSDRVVRVYDVSLDRAIATVCRIAAPSDEIDAVCR